MANNFTVLNSTGGTITIMAVETSTTVYVTQSLPSNSAGNPADFGAGVASSATMRVVLSSAVGGSFSPTTTTMATITAASGTNSTNLSTSSKVLYGAHVYNNGSSTVFLKIYNLASAPTAGSSLVTFNIGVAPGAWRDVNLTGAVSSIGLGYTITGAITSTDTTSVAANDLIGVIEYV